MGFALKRGCYHGVSVASALTKLLHNSKFKLDGSSLVSDNILINAATIYNFLRAQTPGVSKSTPPEDVSVFSKKGRYGDTTNFKTTVDGIN